MLKKISKSKYTLKIGRRTHEIVFSIGLKRLLFERIIEGYFDGMMVEGLSDEAKVELEKLQLQLIDAEGKEEQAKVEKKIKLLYLGNMRLTGEGKVQERIYKTIGDIYSEILAILLTERNNVGEIVKEVTATEVEFSPEYAELEDSLHELVGIVFDIFEETAKKNEKMIERVKGILS